jgi:hypothetical protein
MGIPPRALVIIHGKTDPGIFARNAGLARMEGLELPTATSEAGDDEGEVVFALRGRTGPSIDHLEQILEHRARRSLT